MPSKHPDDRSRNATAAPDVPDPDTPGTPGTPAPGTPDSPGTPGTPDTPAQPHDAFFRSIFGDPAHAAAVLQSILPPAVAAHIDWPSLQPVHASMVSKELAQLHGDLLFKARLAEGRDVFLWLLYEHQSSVERWMSWRMSEMVFDFLRHWLDGHPDAEYLPAVLPVLLYQGTRPWRAPTSLLELTDLSPEARRDLAPHLLSFRLVLDDLCATDDRDIDARLVGPVPRLTLGIMKHYKSPEVLVFLSEHADDVRALNATEYGRLWLSRLLRYIELVHPRVDREALIGLLTALLGEEITEIMLTFDDIVAERFGAEVAERIYERGIEKGLERQRALLLRQLGQRFGAVPEAVAGRVAQAGADDLDRWGDRLLVAASLDELFAAP